MSTQGPLYPSTVANDAANGGDIDWTNLDGLKGDGGTFASYTTGGSYTKYARCTNYGFAIPTNATISGIVVDIRYRAGSSGTPSQTQHSLRLRKSTGFSGDNKASGSFSGTSFDNHVLGSSSDLWGTTWTPSEVNNTGFGFGLAVWDDVGAPSADYVRITVHYITLPDAIDDLTATTITDTIIRADWSAPDSDEAITGYKVEINDGTGWTTHTADTGSTATSFFITGLTHATAYDVRVSAINADGTGDVSNTASATTKDAPVAWPSLARTLFGTADMGLAMLPFGVLMNDIETWNLFARQDRTPLPNYGDIQGQTLLPHGWPFMGMSWQFAPAFAILMNDLEAWAACSGRETERTTTTGLLAVMLAHGLWAGGR